MFPLGGKLNGNLEQGGASAERAEGISESALVAVMEVSLEEMPTTAAAVEAATPLPPVEASIQLDADDKSSIKSPPASKVPDENQDELAMEESERKMYKGKPIFCKTLKHYNYKCAYQVLSGCLILIALNCFIVCMSVRQWEHAL